MNEALITSLLRTTQETMQKQQELLLQQGQEIQTLHSRLASVQYLSYALAMTHPNPLELTDKYMSLMDYAADKIPAHMTELFRDDMNAVLRELLSLRR